MSEPVVDDVAPRSPFVLEMEAAFRRVEEAPDAGARRRACQEMRDVMRKHFGPGWDSPLDAGAAETKATDTTGPRTARPRFRAGLGRRWVGGNVDRKLAAAGPDED